MSITFAPATIRGDVVEHHDGAEFEDVTVNVSAGNAGLVLDALGLLNPEQFADGDIHGDRPAEQFLGAVLLALAIAPADEGVHAYQSAPRWHEGARRPGYLQVRLTDLHVLAEFCVANGYVVAWA